jgi:hypothetical protein
MAEKPRIGRPPKDIDWKIFEELCHIQCTQIEIASALRIALSSLKERAERQYEDDFPTIYKRFADGGKASLRRIQFHLAKKSAGMAIFLGKQYLGQKDNDHAISITPEIAEQFAALMGQLKRQQKVIMVEKSPEAQAVLSHPQLAI